jgi:hypothetical protein
VAVTKKVVLRLAIVVLAAVAAYLVFFWRSAQFVVRDHFTDDKPDALKVLFIGNSQTYVNDLPVVFGKLVQAGDASRGLVITDVVAPGVTLRNHLANGTAARIIARNRWDYVVLQDQSVEPLYVPGTFESSVRKLDALVRQAGAKTALFEVWALEGWTDTELHAQYVRVAEAVGVMLVPVGAVWDRTSARDPSLKLLQADGHHASEAGTYLAACVFYATLVGKSPEGLPTLSVEPRIAAELQRAAR